MYAPIALFVYKRLNHTKRTLKALQKNTLAQESELFVYSDGWKNEEDREKVEEIRNYLKTISGFKHLEIIKKEKNEGLANSIIAGVTDIVNKYGKVIVLEDATIRLPLFDFPGMQVEVGGKKIDHFNNDCRGQEFCYGLITFKLPIGEYDIKAELTDTPIRTTGNYLTIVSIIYFAWLLYKKDEKFT